MYRFRITGTDNTNPYEELIKVFLQPGEYELLRDADSEASTVQKLRPDGSGDDVITFVHQQDKNRTKRDIYRTLQKLTGKSPKWGILTGIRPVKLVPLHSETELKEEYLISDEKYQLIKGIHQYQQDTAGQPKRNSFSMYIGIPFCPTRCLYCSFTSNQVKEEEYDRYLQALYKEIEYAGEAAAKAGNVLESLYFGGGTPTTLNEEQLQKLLHKVSEAFDLSHLQEYTVEAGRPDTITEGKMQVLEEMGVDRVSINPQTMKQETLEIIGRRHTVEDVYKAFEIVGKSGIQIINSDLIAGLPGESEEDFHHSLQEILRLGANNVTLHTLAVKRASRLKETDETYNYRTEELCESMLEAGHRILGDEGFTPYYLYRQKHTSGNTENTGFCKDNTPSIYNIRIMEEAQSILALGAGGISKIYFPDENRLERVANVSNYEIYIDRIDEMIKRKESGYFI